MVTNQHGRQVNPWLQEEVLAWAWFVPSVRIWRACSAKLAVRALDKGFLVRLR